MTALPGSPKVTATASPAALVAPGPIHFALAFVVMLRHAGVPVTTERASTYLDALGLVGFEDRGTVYWAGHATLVQRPEQRPAYDRVFREWWLGHTSPAPSVMQEVLTLTLAVDDPDAPPPAEGDDDATTEDEVLAVRYSPTEVLRHKDFATYTDVELAESRALMARIRLSGVPRRSRRMRPAKSTAGRPDMRRTVRAALRTGGEPVQRRFVRPGTRHRRLVLLLDVSGSMEPYARALLRFVHAAVVGRSKVEVFTIGTRLHRVTRELSTRDPDSALSAAGRTVDDWSGGTRLGEVIRDFNDRWGVRGLARGAIVVVLSDGWDRGDPEVLAEQLARLQRVAFRVVWVNPLKASPGYQPLAAGMAAALPFVDRFVEGHSLDSLEELARVIDETGTMDLRRNADA